MPRPYPEALPGARGDGWKVQPLPHGGRTDLVRRLMFADCSASDVGLMTRIHEQPHAALTPVKGADDLVDEYGVHPFALQAAEDCRLNHAVQIMRSRGTLAGPLADVYLGETMLEATLSAWRDQWIRARDTGGAVAVDGAASAVCLAVACYPGEDWVGAVWSVYQVAKEIGIEDALGKDFQGKLALWQVMSRVIDQGSRLSAVRLVQVHAGDDVLDMVNGVTP